MRWYNVSSHCPAMSWSAKLMLSHQETITIIILLISPRKIEIVVLHRIRGWRTQTFWSDLGRVIITVWNPIDGVLRRCLIYRWQTLWQHEAPSVIHFTPMLDEQNMWLQMEDRSLQLIEMWSVSMGTKSWSKTTFFWEKWLLFLPALWVHFMDQSFWLHFKIQ